ALARIGEPCGDMLDRFFARDQSYRTIGEELDLPAGTIASRISRCLEKLKGAMEDSGALVSPEVGRLEKMATFDIEKIVRLIAALPPTPEGWVRAAQELPQVRRGLDDLLVRAEADPHLRQGVSRDLGVT